MPTWSSGPERAQLKSRADLTIGGIYRRRFAGGIAYYNPSSREPYYLVGAQGAHSPKQGGTGSVQFLGPYQSTILSAKRGAIVVSHPATGR